MVRTKRRAFRLGRLCALLEQQYTQPRSFWKLLRSAQTPIPVSLQPVQVWDAYLDELADIGRVENPALPPAAFPQHLLDPAACLNVAVSEEEVQDGLIALHNGRAKGVQGVPSELFRYAKPEPAPGQPAPLNVLAPIVTEVLNAAFRAGTVSSQVNGGLVTPVFKKGDPFCTENYRPIAGTEPIMRLYAHILNARLVNFTEDNDIYSDTQSGFRPGLSTLHSVFCPAALC